VTVRTFTEFGAELAALVADVTATATAWADGSLSDLAQVETLTGAQRARAVLLLGEVRSADVTTLTRPTDIMDAIRWREELGAQLIRLIGRLLSVADAAQIARGSMLTQRRGYSVRTGDTLQSIAHRHYGDWQKWALLAEANQINPAAELTPGMYLIIPEPDPRTR
jgi:hypothetical protein